MSAYADAVIVAAGSSSRMGGHDKLQEPLLGWPTLRWALEAMLDSGVVRSTILVARAERLAELGAASWVGERRVRVIEGGARRQDSVAAGVRASDAEVVLVHDAARPLVDADLVGRVAAAAREYGAAIPVVPVADSLKRVVDGAVVGSVERSGLSGAQTPQGARRELLLRAVEAFSDSAETFGDEAELLARMGVGVAAVAGDPANLKVTRPADLEMARRLAAGRAVPRYATGGDSHPFGPRDGLRLGGLEIAEAPRLHGHSDGDVVLHAVCSGLLAAIGEGDLGRLFPAGDPYTRDIDSGELLDAVLRRVAAAGWRPLSADVSIVGARPRLGAARLTAMACGLAARLGTSDALVSVKASSGNLSGPEGAGRAISASCLVGVTAR